MDPAVGQADGGATLGERAGAPSRRTAASPPQIPCLMMLYLRLGMVGSVAYTPNQSLYLKNNKIVLFTVEIIMKDEQGRLLSAV